MEVSPFKIITHDPSRITTRQVTIEIKVAKEKSKKEWVD